MNKLPYGSKLNTTVQIFTESRNKRKALRELEHNSTVLISV